MNHDAARDRLLELAYGELGSAESSRVEAHLRTCPQCRAELEAISATRTAMRRLPPERAPEAGERVLLAAGREAAARMGEARRRSSASAWLRLAATAALVVAVGGTSWRILVARRERPAEAPIDVALPAAPAPPRSVPEVPRLAEAAPWPQAPSPEAERRGAAPPADRGVPRLAARGEGRAEAAADASFAARAKVAAARPAAAAPSLAAPPSTAATRASPGAAAAEGAAREVDLLRAGGNLSLADEQRRRCGDAEVRMEVWRDRAGRARRLVVTSSDRSGSRRADLLYDAGGRLRLARVEAEDGGGGVSRGRIAFDSSGSRVLEEGAGPAWPDAELPRGAEAGMVSPPCPP